MLKTANNSLAGDDPLRSVTTTGTNSLLCVNSTLDRHLMMPRSLGGPSRASTSQPSTHISTMKKLIIQSSFGRVLLHLACVLQRGNLRWHWAGICREFKPAARSRMAGLTILWLALAALPTLAGTHVWSGAQDGYWGRSEEHT